MNLPCDLNSFIIISLVCWGFWGIADKKALSYGSQYEVILCLYALSFLFIPLIAFILNIVHPGWSLSFEVMGWTGLAAFCYTIAIFSYLSAMSKTEASFVLGITASYPIVLQFLAAAFLGEQLVPQRILGGLVIGAGIGMISGSVSKNDNRLTRHEYISLAACVILATLCWGVWGIFDKKALSISGPLEVYLAQRLWDVFFFFVLLMIFWWRKVQLSFRNEKLWLFCGLSEAAIGGGGLSYLAALSVASASYVITITGCYPLLMYLFALLFLKEKFNKMRFAGISLVVLGGLLVQLTQGIN